MLHHLCGPPSIPLSFNLAIVLPRRLAYSVCGLPESKDPRRSQHRWLHGLTGYLIPVAPHAFTPQRQSWARGLPSHLVFLLISTDFTLPREILPSSLILKYFGFESTSKVELWTFTFQLQIPPTCSLRPVILNNACPLCLTAAAGTELAGTCFWSFVIIFASSKSFTTKIAFITHAISLDQAFAHCLRFLTAASRRSLGRVSVLVWLIVLSDQLRITGLVSHYLTNNLILRRLILQRSTPLWNYLGFYPKLKGKFLRITHPFATQKKIEFNLHVLSVLLAFILGQDQTQLFF